MKQLWYALRGQCHELAVMVLQADSVDPKTFKVEVVPGEDGSSTEVVLTVATTRDGNQDYAYCVLPWGNDGSEVSNFLRRKGQINCLTWDDVQREIDIINYERQQEAL